MATFGEMQSAVSKRLLDSANLAASALDVASALNDAVRYWKNTRLWFNEGVSSQTMVANDATIPLPSLFFLPAYESGSFIVSYSGQRYPLAKISGAEYDAIMGDSTYGLPCAYAYIGGSYEAYPTPDTAYTIIVRYLKDYTDMVQSDYNATNDWTTNAPRLLILWACANLIGELRQDDKMEAYFRNAAQNEVNNLLQTTNMRNATGTLAVTSF
jgi:hypothetical protein